MKGAENMTVSKNPTSLKLSMDVENGTNRQCPPGRRSRQMPRSYRSHRRTYEPRRS